jgi:hypothetical protein
MHVGDKVRARYGATAHGAVGTSWYSGTIVKVYEDDRYDIQYDDNDFEVGVLLKYIKLVSSNGKSTSPNKKDQRDTSGSMLPDKHSKLYRSEITEDSRRKRQKVAFQTEPHAMEPRRHVTPPVSGTTQPAMIPTSKTKGNCHRTGVERAPAVAAAGAPAEAVAAPAKSPESRPRTMSGHDAGMANTIIVASTLAADIASDLDAQKNIPVCEHGDVAGWYRISKQSVLDSMLCETSALQPGRKFRALLPGCHHRLKLSWPKEHVSTFKFALQSCKKCAFVAQTAQP